MRGILFFVIITRAIDTIETIAAVILSGEKGDGDDDDRSANISDPGILIFLIKCFCLTTYEYWI
jgi:hypothetical protein